MGGYWSSVPTLPADQHIVIVGAGYGGITLGTELLKHKANFTIISPRDCFHHNVGALRASVQPGKTVLAIERRFRCRLSEPLPHYVSVHKLICRCENGFLSVGHLEPEC